MESLLLDLMVPCNETIAQATALLNERLRQSAYGCVDQLLEVLLGSHRPEARQMAAVLLRQRVVKTWVRLPRSLHPQLKDSLLQVLASDPEPAVRVATAGVVSVIAQFELPAKQWPELPSFLYDCCQSPDPSQRELGFKLLNQVTEAAPPQDKAHRGALLELLGRSMADEHLVVGARCIQALTSMVPHLARADLPAFHALVPPSLAVLKRALPEDEALAREILDLYEEASDINLPLLKPSLTELTQLLLAISADRTLEDATRCKALSIIQWLVLRKAKGLAKRRLVAPILEALCQIMAEEPSEEELAEIEEAGGEDAASDAAPRVFAAFVLDICSCNIPPELVFPAVAAYVQTMCQSARPLDRCAGYSALTAITEGSRYHIRRSGELPTILQLTYGGMADPEIQVRRTSCVALSKLAKECQPEVSENHADLLPRLFHAMDDASSDVRESACYALEQVIDNMGEAVVPYLAELMERMMYMTGLSDDMHQVALGCIAVISRAAEIEFLPYMESTVTHLRSLLEIRDFERLNLVLQAIDTAGCLATCTGGPHFEGYVDVFMEAVQRISAETDDPDIAVAAYSFYGSMADLLLERFGGFLPAIMPRVFTSCESDKSLQADVADEGPVVWEEEDGDEGEGAEGAGPLGYFVMTSYLREQEAACNLLGVLADRTSTAFVEYIDNAYKICMEFTTRKQIGHPAIREAVFGTLLNLAKGLHAASQLPPWVKGLPPAVPVPELVNTLLMSALSLVLEALSQEREIKLAIALIEGLNELLQQIGPAALANSDALRALAGFLTQVFQFQTEFQQGFDPDDEVDDDGHGQDEEEDQLAEYESVAVEVSAELLSTVARVLGGSFGELAPVFIDLLTLFAQPSRPESERSMCIGTLSEIIEAMENFVEPLVDHLLQVFFHALQDPSTEVRSNGAYGIGLLCQYGGGAVAPHLDLVLSSLYSNCLHAGPEFVRARDNACSAVSRILVAHTATVNVDQLLPALLGALPLQEDFEENVAVMRCFCFLAEHMAAEAVAQNYLGPFLSAAAVLIAEQHRCNEEVNQLLHQFLQLACHRFGAVLPDALATLPAEVQSILQPHLQLH